MSLLNVKLVRARRRDGLGNAQLTAGTFCRAIVRRALRGFTYRRIMSEKEIAISDNRHERLSQTDIGNDALTRLDLLERVVLTRNCSSRQRGQATTPQGPAG